MAADIFTRATQLAILQAGRAPAWVEQVPSELPPSLSTDGTPLQGACRTLLHVPLRQDPGHRTVMLYVPTVDLTATYTFSSDTATVDYDASLDTPADKAELLEGLAAAINGDVDLVEIVVATAVDTDDDGIVDAVSVVGLLPADFPADFTADGTAVVEIVGDPESALLRVWFLMDARRGSTAPTAWVCIDPVGTSLDLYGYIERFETAGFLRMYVQLTDYTAVAADGVGVLYQPVVSVGPCLSEVES